MLAGCWRGRELVHNRVLQGGTFPSRSMPVLGLLQSQKDQQGFPIIQPHTHSHHLTKLCHSSVKYDRGRRDDIFLMLIIRLSMLSLAHTRICRITLTSACFVLERT